MLVFHLVKHFSFELVDPSQTVHYEPGLTLTVKGGVKVHCTEREVKRLDFFVLYFTP